MNQKTTWLWVKTLYHQGNCSNLLGFAEWSQLCVPSTQVGQEKLGEVAKVTPSHSFILQINWLYLATDGTAPKYDWASHAVRMADVGSVGQMHANPKAHVTSAQTSHVCMCACVHPCMTVYDNQITLLLDVRFSCSGPISPKKGSL